jgi:hypothetical protein
VTPEHIVASILAAIAATIASGLTYLAMRLRRGVRVRGVLVEYPFIGGEDVGYVRSVRYTAGPLGDRICRPLDLVRTSPGEIGAEVELLYDPKNPKLVTFADFQPWKPAMVAWGATLFIACMIFR